LLLVSVSQPSFQLLIILHIIILFCQHQAAELKRAKYTSADWNKHKRILHLMKFSIRYGGL